MGGIGTPMSSCDLAFMSITSATRARIQGYSLSGRSPLTSVSPQSAEMPLSRASRIEHFVIQYIYNQEFDGKDGATIKTLVDVLREEFCNESTWRIGESPRNEKMEMRNAIRMMASKELLATIDGTGPIAFTIHPSVDVRKYLLKTISRQLSRQASAEFERREVAPEPTLDHDQGEGDNSQKGRSPVTRQHCLEVEHHQVVQELPLDEPIGQSETQSLQRDNLDSKPPHVSYQKPNSDKCLVGQAEAYAEMIKGAVPLFLSTEMLKPPEQIEIEQNEVFVPQARNERKVSPELPTPTSAEAPSTPSEVFTQPEASRTNPGRRSVAKSPSEQGSMCGMPTTDAVVTLKPQPEAVFQPKHPGTEPAQVETKLVSQIGNEQKCLPELLTERILESLEAQPKAVFHPDTCEVRTSFTAHSANGVNDALKMGKPSTRENHSPKLKEASHQEPLQTQQDGMEADTAMSGMHASEPEDFNAFRCDLETPASPSGQNRPEAVLDATSSPTSELAPGSGYPTISDTDLNCLAKDKTKSTTPWSLTIAEVELIANVPPKHPSLNSSLEGNARDQVQDRGRDVTPAPPPKDLHKTEGITITEHQSQIEVLRSIESDIKMTEDNAVSKDPVFSREPALTEVLASAEESVFTAAPESVGNPISVGTSVPSKATLLEEYLSSEGSFSPEDPAQIEDLISNSTPASFGNPVSIAEDLRSCKKHAHPNYSASIDAPLLAEDSMAAKNQLFENNMASVEAPVPAQETSPVQDQISSETLAIIDEPMRLEGHIAEEIVASIGNHISTMSASIAGPKSIESPLSTDNSLPLKERMLIENSTATENLAHKEDPKPITVQKPVEDATLFQSSELTENLVLPKRKPENTCGEYFNYLVTGLPAELFVSFAPGGQDISQFECIDSMIVDNENLDAEGLVHSLPEIETGSNQHLELLVPRLNRGAAPQENLAVLPTFIQDMLQKKQDGFRQQVFSPAVAQISVKKSSEVMSKPRQLAGQLPSLLQQRLSEVGSERSELVQLNHSPSSIAQSLTPPKQQSQKPRNPLGRAGFVSQGHPRSCSETNPLRAEYLRHPRTPLGWLDSNSLFRNQRVEDPCPKSQEDDHISASQILPDNFKDSLDKARPKVERVCRVSRVGWFH